MQQYKHDGAGYIDTLAEPENEYVEQDDQEQEELHPVEKLQAFVKSQNIATDLTKEQLNKIGAEVVRGYDLDKASRTDWERQTKTAMELAMQVAQEKSWPWPKSANVKYPLITTAAIQFSARAYPNIIRGAEVVKGEVFGPDPDGSKIEKADRIGQHMSYQLLEQMEDWEEETDRLLLEMAIVGCVFRKTYFDTSLGRNVSELVSAKNLVYNHAVKFKKLRRITHELHLYKNDVIERIRGGIFENIELGMPDGQDSDEDGYFEFLEQHCWYDLDDDGYKEPYIVTVRRESAECVRIVARYDEDGIYLNDKAEIGKIEPVEYFTKFPFMPNPDGGSYDVGLGILLNPINETINTVLNQLLDAGTLSNTGGGFIGSGLRMKGGATRFTPGEFKHVDNKGAAIRDNIYHMEFPGPSPVLFQLLNMLIEAGKDISSVKDILTGEQNINQTATTTLALIEQGQKVFSAIYKRVHRSLKAEFKKLFRLNKLYLQPEEYYKFEGNVQPIALQDYQGGETDVAPVSDPNLVSDAQELTRAQALLQFADDPLFNPLEIRRRYLKAIKEENIDALLVKEMPDPSHNPAAMEMQARMKELDIKGQEMEARAREIDAKIEAMHVSTTADTEKSMAEIEKLKTETGEIEASAILKMAQAEALELGTQMQAYISQFESMIQAHTAALDQYKAVNDTQNQRQQLQQQSSDDGAVDDGQGSVSSMGEQPADQAVPPVPPGLPGQADGGLGDGGIQSGFDGANSNAPIPNDGASDNATGVGQPG